LTLVGAEKGQGCRPVRYARGAESDSEGFLRVGQYVGMVWSLEGLREAVRGS